MPIPLSVRRDELSEAIKPLCDLLGTSFKNLYDSPGITIGDGKVAFTVPLRHEDEPAGRVPAAKAWGRIVPPNATPPHPQGVEAKPRVVGEGEGIEWAYDVEIDVVP